MDTRAQIIVAGRDLYVRHGEAGFSMRKLARELGLSAAAIYRHFPDKEHLLMEVCREGFELFGSYLMRGLLGKTPLERLERIGRGYVEFALEHPHYYRVMFMSPHPDYVKLQDRSSQAFSPTFQMLVDRVFECQRAGDLSQELDAYKIAASTWAHLHGAVSLWLDGHLTDLLPDDDAFRAFLERYHTHPTTSLRP